MGLTYYKVKSFTRAKQIEDIFKKHGYDPEFKYDFAKNRYTIYTEDTTGEDSKRINEDVHALKR